MCNSTIFICTFLFNLMLIPIIMKSKIRREILGNYIYHPLVIQTDRYYKLIN